MRLPDWLVLAAVVGASILLFVLWTDYAYDRGFEASQSECEYEMST